MKSIAVTETVTMEKVFEPRLAVFRVKVTFIAPYRKCKYLYVEPKDIKTKAAFLKRIRHIAAIWPNGDYYLKLSDGRVFARFAILNGKLNKFYRNSPITQKEYPIWAWWK
jgi:hypothetical protein